MPHDDSKTCERLFGPLGKHHMMAPLFIHLNKTQPWSPCSAMYLTEFLDGGHGKAQFSCLVTQNNLCLNCSGSLQRPEGCAG